MQTITHTFTKTDARIKADVLSELAWDPYIRDTTAGITVRNGIVTITGVANSLAARLAIVDAAHRVQGVLDVVDEMTVSPSPSTIRTDADVAQAVREALRWDAYLPDDRIATTVSSGVVTLQGNVTNWAHRIDHRRREGRPAPGGRARGGQPPDRHRHRQRPGGHQAPDRARPRAPRRARGTPPLRHRA